MNKTNWGKAFPILDVDSNLDSITGEDELCLICNQKSDFCHEFEFNKNIYSICSKCKKSISDKFDIDIGVKFLETAKPYYQAIDLEFEFYVNYIGGIDITSGEKDIFLRALKRDFLLDKEENFIYMKNFIFDRPDISVVFYDWYIEGILNSKG